MKALKEANPDTDYYFIIGGDMVEYLPKWHRIDDLLHLVQFVGIRRPLSNGIYLSNYLGRCSADGD